ncbi:MAG: hypothetical protein M3Z46_11150 [Actinomycetota bacterium]|nr:hypothetical protein [Actinomycetota bacterium]
MSTPEVARNARLEAQQLLGDGYRARVLEPSPPAVLDDDSFADDPVAIDGAPRGAPLLSPVAGGDLTWQQWLDGHPEHGDWAAARWLGSYPRLTPPPPTFAATRSALHRVAVYVVSPSRRRVNTKIGLRFTLGGFGTPFFAGVRGDEQLRVVGGDLVRQVGDTATVEPISTLNQSSASALEGPPDVAWAEGFDVPPPGDPDEPLAIDPAAAHLLGQWIGFSWSVLEAVRADAASIEPSRVQLWPEHFDAAFDCLAGHLRRAVTFGASPGDAGVHEPYLYVLPADFDALAPSELWNAQGFDGAVLPLRELIDQPDQRAAALGFFRDRRSLVGG